ncbi:MAG: nucleotidyltransferase domain-containing protein [Chloroflexi bacterium]|nr:nucleotidyltransferase domain-containing protein [Chloroflexota bacterium]
MTPKTWATSANPHASGPDTERIAGSIDESRRYDCAQAITILAALGPPRSRVACVRAALACRHTRALILASMNAPAAADSETPTGGRKPMRVVEDPLNRETIQAITQLIVERFQPEQIILFGSVARSEEDHNSDLDLMVVLRHNDEQGRDGYAIRLAIAQNFVLPVDILIRSADLLARYRQDPNSMLSRMLEDSEVLYDRPAA